MGLSLLATRFCLPRYILTLGGIQGVFSHIFEKDIGLNTSIRFNEYMHWRTYVHMSMRMRVLTCGDTDKSHGHMTLHIFIYFL